MRSTLEGGSRKNRAIAALHRHTLGSYEKWARGMQGLTRDEEYGTRPGGQAAEPEPELEPEPEPEPEPDSFGGRNCRIQGASAEPPGLG